MSQSEALVAQIDAVLARCDAPEGVEVSPSTFERRSDTWLAEQGTACLALIDRIAPSSEYARKAREPEQREYPLAHTHTLTHLIGVVRALRADVVAGYLQSLVALVHAEVYSDFLEMADHLLESGYKDAAAVLAGSTLEEHLRNLAERAGVPTLKPGGGAVQAGTLNSDLRSLGVYGSLDHKSVTAWLDLRNQAAHGHYGAYDDRHVESLIRDVRNFIARHQGLATPN